MSTESWNPALTAITGPAKIAATDVSLAGGASWDAVDTLPPEALVELLTRLGAVAARAKARLTIAGTRVAETPQPDEGLTAQDVSAMLKAKAAWVYRHRRQLGGTKYDGIVRFTRRGVEAYLRRQRSRAA
jgi:hypothetical protein